LLEIFDISQNSFSGAFPISIINNIRIYASGNPHLKYDVEDTRFQQPSNGWIF